ncbi:MAG: type II toxin-antitoxin system ParD family antitoxin [Acidobacteriota bacterium]|jgi:Arc/MetJ-type ribon-helix-helix transcriptional regulator
MTITLNAEQERLIAQAMQAGGYQNVDDVIVRALEILRAEDGFLHEQKGAISAKIDNALAQFERGEFLSAEESRSDMEQRKASWLRDQPR